MRLTDKGQVTIPIAVRNQLGLRPGDEVEFVVDGDEVKITRSARTPRRGRRMVDNLRGRGDVPMSTAEIMALTRGE
jgi:AbrB family looped-hinge helix DNA binding protein